MTNPIRPTDDDARRLARDLLQQADHAALAVIAPETGAPSLSRIAMALDPAGWPVSLVSTLAGHTRALAARPECSLMVGEVADRGDPLTHPRLTLQARAHPVMRTDAGFDALRAHVLALRPKTKLYIDFGDFHFIRFEPLEGFLNGGFGRAFQLRPEDLLPG
ncbi:HugZ family protein [Pseudooceanicola sp. C21-150M6]|uniref:HugZ family pyridoxamine 5'-phosphate oxidase n=1 Tax=Pseudooceanicola sp. C21-150M6 TaxID=3434355 RepID=UPI003D7F7A0F